MRSCAIPTIVLVFSLLAGGMCSAAAIAQEPRCGGDIPANATPVAVAPGEWASLPDMPRPRSELAAAVVEAAAGVSARLGYGAKRAAEA